MSHNKKKIQVAFVCNTRKENDEFQVEYEPEHTIELVQHAIKAAGWEYIHIEADETCYENLKKIKPTIVLNRAEGISGESRESHIPAFCEMLQIPYVGAGIMTTAICLDKPTTKKILEYHQIKTAPFTVLFDKDEKIDQNLKYPLILKPSHEGSSIGINEDNVVDNEKELRQKISQMLQEYNQPILVEEFIDGREFSVGFYGNFEKDNQPIILPIFEVDFTKFDPKLKNVLGQRAKTIYDTSKNYICPANIPESLKREIEENTLKIIKILNCKDWGRVDYRYNKQGRLYFLEINPLPGIDFDVEKDDFSFYPYMWIKGGYTFDQMVKYIVSAGLKRYKII
ncbi:ATP-grasp domain-containing protein [Candidatus Bathyarchaeota archaeon]|nr:ATP-grasp domain-containing protein [Candidatus Bathyarchaeota archaeon]